MNKSELGQVFTTNSYVQQIFGELHDVNKNRILEPSFGTGDLIKSIDNFEYLLGIEYDKSVYKNVMADSMSLLKDNISIIHGCFFETISTLNAKFNSVISNPPYVAINKYKDMSKDMGEFANLNKFKGNYNILYLFILKAAQLVEDDGEIIFIVPKDFTYSTYAKPLRDYLQNGIFTHWIDCKEEKIFEHADLESAVIFRWIKNNNTKETLFFSSIEDYRNSNGKSAKGVFFGENLTLMFSEIDLSNHVPLSTLFDVKVGSVSGCDEVFRVEKGSKLARLSCVKKMVSGIDKVELFIDTNDYKSLKSMPKILRRHLIKNKSKLVNRYGIDPSNWWRWSFLRNAKVSMSETNLERIFVSAKTRKTPFWLGNKNGFIGSVYALFPKNNSITIKDAIEYLNGEECQKLLSSCGMKTNDKFKATPKAIGDIPFPRKLIERTHDQQDYDKKHTN